ncbi:MAG: 3-dehydroquinate synthase [Bacteroidales bacterium]|nr:3-dehydroquinate synthase [Bacteroidales bacterium]
MNTLELVSKGGASIIIIGGDSRKFLQGFDPARTLVLADENLLTYHRKKFDSFNIISIGAGEQAKSMTRAIELYHKLLELEVDRSWTLIGAGGGIATDLSGFIASTYLRGISFAFVSTTLLGQVDASIGGKNGVNLDGFKNMIGVINQPAQVFCDIDSLSSLPEREFLAGFAEIVKYGAIRDPEFFEYLERNIESGIKRDAKVLEYMISRSVKNKIEVVQADERELGERKTLNFGHTFAHGFEKLYKIPHGEAVSLGMVLAAKLSVKLGLLEAEKAERIEKLLIRCSLPVSFKWEVEVLAEAMKKDKKRSGGSISFILLKDIGKAVIHKLEVQTLKTVLHDLR